MIGRNAEVPCEPVERQAAGGLGSLVPTAVPLKHMAHWPQDAGGKSGFTATIVVPLRRWERTVTRPAMLLVWSFGAVLAIDARWFAAP